MNSASFPLRFHVQQVKSDINRRKITMRLDLPSVTWEHWHFIFFISSERTKNNFKVLCLISYTQTILSNSHETGISQLEDSIQIHLPVLERVCVCVCVSGHLCMRHEDEQRDEWRWAYCELICLNRVLTPESICPQLHRRIRVNKGREEIRMHVFISSLTSSSYCPTFWLPAADTNPNFMKSSKSAAVLNLGG